jgi:HEPN domain-containing protein
MLPEPEVLRQSKRWLDYADQDLRPAQHAFTLPDTPPFRLIAYLAQQCAEKHLKAYLVFKGVDFPHSHNISHLLELCATQRAWPEDLVAADELTPFAVAARYPGEEDEVTRGEASRAVDIAARVREAVRQALESEGLTLGELSTQ